MWQVLEGKGKWQNEVRSKLKQAPRSLHVFYAWSVGSFARNEGSCVLLDVLVGVPDRFSSPFSTLAICYAEFILRAYGVLAILEIILKTFTVLLCIVLHDDIFYRLRV